MDKRLFLAGLVLFSAMLACMSGGSTAEPKAAVAPMTLGGDLSAIDVCKAIPQEDIEAVMGRKLTSPPERFSYYDEPSTNGCAYDAGKDSAGSAYFGYVVLAPVAVYNNQPLYKNTTVKDLGQEAYFNNGADARQLWVKVNDTYAFVVGFGDEPRETGALALARLVLAALK